jgi:hypothetical protein
MNQMFRFLSNNKKKFILGLRAPICGRQRPYLPAPDEPYPDAERVPSNHHSQTGAKLKIKTFTTFFEQKFIKILMLRLS